MDNNKAAAIRITRSTPGWAYLQEIVETKIEHARLAALVNTEESQVMELWRRAQVADQLFRTFLQDLDTLTDN